MSAAGEAVLLSRARRGDAAAFRTLHDRHRAALRRSVARLLAEPHDVEDVVQETFLRAFVALRSGRSTITDLRPWLFRVAHNRAIDVLRSRRPTEELSEASASSSNVPVLAERREELRRAVAAVNRLPEGQRRALVLNALEGRPYDAVARQLDVTPGAAKALAWRGRDAVRRDLLAAA